MIVEKNGKLIPIEIKLSTTHEAKWWKNIMDWQVFSKSTFPGMIIYGGKENYDFSDGRKVLSYNSIAV